MLPVILIVELAALYFLSRRVTQAIFMFFLLLFRARSVAVSLLLVLEFPGTVLHELSHLFTAEILGVRTGKMTLEPENIREDHIRSGSVMIAQSDPFRRYAIGLAPVFWGITVLTAIAYFLPQQSDWTNWTNWVNWILGYLLFAVSNTMFSSPEDLDGFIPFAIVSGIIVAGAYALGLRIVLTGQISEVVIRIAETLTKSLGIVLAVNILLLILLMVTTRILTRIMRVKIVK